MGFSAVLNLDALIEPLAAPTKKENCEQPDVDRTLTCDTLCSEETLFGDAGTSDSSCSSASWDVFGSSSLRFEYEDHDGAHSEEEEESEGAKALDALLGMSCAPQTIDVDRLYEDVVHVEEWIPNKFSLVRTLQQAPRNDGRVDMMHSLELGAFVAVKCMPRWWVTDGPKEFRHKRPISSEQPWLDIAIVKQLNELSYPYVCKYHGVLRDDENTYVVSSLATDGDLFTWSGFETCPGQEREAVMLPIVRQILDAVCLLHNLGVAHQDLSLENILLTDGPGGEKRIKIIDFGMAILDRHSSCNLARGKCVYQAPEVHEEEKAPDLVYDTFLADSWSLGVAIFCLASHDYPWRSTKLRACPLFKFVCNTSFGYFLHRRKAKEVAGSFLIDIFSLSLIELLSGLLAIKPDERFTLGESCWEAETRTSVWTSSWLHEAADGQLSRPGQEALQGDFVAAPATTTPSVPKGDFVPALRVN
jgi:serine/threonine protein kinase